MSQNNVWRFHQIRKIGLEKHEKNKLPPEEEVGLEARERSRSRHCRDNHRSKEKFQPGDVHASTQAQG